MPQLSNYTQTAFDGGANPLHIASRASSKGAFGDAGEVYLTENEARELRDYLNSLDL